MEYQRDLEVYKAKSTTKGMKFQPNWLFFEKDNFEELKKKIELRRLLKDRTIGSGL